MRAASAPVGKSAYAQPMFRRLVARLGHRRWFSAIGSRVLPRLDRAVYRASGHRWMVATIAFPTLLLHAGGRQPVPLLFVREGPGYLVAATNWGRPEHPAWSNRLLSGSPATIEIHRGQIPVRVRRLSPAEMAEAWPRLLEVWPAFETYRRRTRREVRVFLLTPAGDPAVP